MQNSKTRKNNASRLQPKGPRLASRTITVIEIGKARAELLRRHLLHGGHILLPLLSAVVRHEGIGVVQCTRKRKKTGNGNGMVMTSNIWTKIVISFCPCSCSFLCWVSVFCWVARPIGPSRRLAPPLSAPRSLGGLGPLAKSA